MFGVGDEVIVFFENNERERGVIVECPFDVSIDGKPACAVSIGGRITIILESNIR